MKKLFYLVGLLMIANFVFVSCSSPTSDRGVVISGVRWATRNVDAIGTFARNPENVGGFFIWYHAADACPRGWRLPTLQEWEALKGAGSVWYFRNGVGGRLFGTAPNQIFLPAAGFDGAHANVGDVGFYWSSTQELFRGPLTVYPAAAWYLRFGSGSKLVSGTDIYS